MQSKIVNPLTVTIEYSSIKALKMEFKLADSVNLQYSFIVHLILPEQYYLKTL
jgi:hypothetical protein